MVPDAWRVGAGVVAVMTLVVVLRAETMADAVLAVVVSGLLIVQIPLDVRIHHLSRRATMIAAALVSTVIVIDVIANGGGVRSAVLAFGVAAVVIAVYGLLHRHSPRSLGWGGCVVGGSTHTGGGLCRSRARVVVATYGFHNWCGACGMGSCSKRW